MKWWFRQQLYTQIFICIVIGVVLGIFVSPEKVKLIEPIGDIFINLLMMLIVPLTVSTLISGITKLEDLRSLRSLGGLTILYYGASSFVAGGLGLSIALIIRPGKEAIGLLGEAGQPGNFNFVENLVSWFPRNPVGAMANTEMLQIIVFSIIVGIGLIVMGKKAEGLTKIVDDGAKLMITITEFVMKTAPYGILALVANMVANLGASMLKEVTRFLAADFAALFVLLVVMYPLLLKFIGNVNPPRFYRNVLQPMLVAASTTSSAATLPVSMAAAEDNLGLPEKIWGFTLPLGATINMNGMAAAIGVIGVFACNLHDIPITPALMLQFMFLGMVLSVGTAGVRGAGLVMSSILLTTVGLPLALIPVLAALWPILDIGHTACNVTGDLVGSTIIGSRMGMLDEGAFYGLDSENKQNEVVANSP